MLTFWDDVDAIKRFAGKIIRNLVIMILMTIF